MADDAESGWFSDLLSQFGSGIVKAGSNAIDYFTTPKGVVQLGSMGLGYLGSQSNGFAQPQIPPTGYQGGVPALRAQRTQVPQMLGEEMSDGSIRPMGSPTPTGLGALAGPQGTGREAQMMYDPNRRPGSSGRRYFTDTQYIAEDDDIGAAEKRMAAQAAKLSEANIRNPARQELMGGGVGGQPGSMLGSQPKPQYQPDQRLMAAGGLAGLKKGKYLDGSTDGMADRVPARIDGRQEARLSDGEFVIPADIVSHLGNGNSDAGAKVLEQMMSRVRKARTGNKKQGKEIDPKTILPV